MKKIILALAALSPFAVLANGADVSGWNMMPWSMMGYGWGGFFMFAYSTIFLIVGVLVIVWLWQHIDKK
ncbi:MAG: hypothetical protein HYY55_01605 [Candidatus Niyogibacteria bacterium]|nr:MAG: hypothetical protein HYY55_01605 [Candidatus Niyogibacteria bacterium]